jgi:hypothetical protein
VAFSWFVYTPLSAKEALAVEDRLRAVVGALIASRPALAKVGQEWGDVTVEEALPSADDVAELSDAFGRPVSDDVLDRLDTCRSSLCVERNGVHDLDPLQVSLLRWLIDNLGPCLVDWGDMNIVLSEDVLTDIDEYPSAGNLDGTGPIPADPAAAPAADAPVGDVSVGVERATETGQAIEAVSEDPFLRRRFMRLVESYPQWVKTYVKILEERGPVGDAVVSKELGVAVDKLDPHLQKLHDEALDLADEADE